MVINSLRQAFNALFKFRTWFLVLLPPFIAGFTLLGLFLYYWQPLSIATSNTISQWGWVQWLGNTIGFSEILGAILSSGFLILVFFPVLFVVVLIVTSIFVTPIVQREVSLKYFAKLEKKQGGSNLGSAWNSIKALLVFVCLFVVTLPLWFIPGLQLVVPALLVISLNKKVFLYDVLQDFASEEERKSISKKYSLGLWGLGALLVVFSYLPLAFVILPVFSAFAYSFFALNALEELRKA